MNTFNITLDLNKGNVTTPIRLRQGDLDGTTITALILDHGATADLTGLTARFVMELPGGEHYYRKDATVGEGSVTVTINEEQAASVTGRTTRAYFQLLDGETVRASTGSVTVDILPDALEGHTVPADYDSAIQDAIDALDDAVEHIADTVEDVLEDHPEWTTTVQDGSITDAKLIQHGGILDRAERLMFRLDNLLTATPAESDSLTVTDAAKTPLAGLALYGRSTQDGTPSPDAPVAIQSVTPNLLDPSIIQQGTISSSGDQGNTTRCRTAMDSKFIVSAGQSYVCVGAATSGTLQYSVVYYADAEDTSTSIAGTTWLTMGTSFTVPSGANALRLHFRRSDNAIFAPSDIGDAALYQGTSAPSYVPYGCAGLHSVGANQLSMSTFDKPTTNYLGCTMTRNGDGSWTLSGTNTSTSVWNFNSNAGEQTFPAGTYTFLNGGGPLVGCAIVLFTNLPIGNQREGTFTASAPFNVTKWAVEVGSSATIGGMARPILVNVTEQSVTLIDLQGHVLRSLPDGTRDEVTVDQYGHATLIQRVGHVVLDGSGTEVYSVGSAGTYNRNVVATGTGWIGAGHPDAANAIYIAMCDRLEAKNTIYNTWTTPGISGWTDSSAALILGFPKDVAFSDQATFKTWLASNPLTIDYALATPVTIDLGWTDAIPLCGPDLTAQSVPSAPFALTYERDLNVTLARLEAAIAELA